MSSTQSTCLIIDDDNFASETLADFLSAYDNLEILKILNESTTAIKHIAFLKPDLVFLDVNMPDKNGLSILNEINELELDTKVIFITAYHEYLMDALKKNAYDYLIKPIKKHELDESLNRYFNSGNSQRPSNRILNKSQEEKKIVLKNAHGSLILKPEEILYVEADGCYTQIHLANNKTETISKNLGNIESLFPETLFFKISRSVLVNLLYINKINRLKRFVYLLHKDEEIVLKASKEKLYSLESHINQ